MQGVQSVILQMQPATVLSSVDCCVQLLQSLSQGKSLAESMSALREAGAEAPVIYGLIAHKAALK